MCHEERTTIYCPNYCGKSTSMKPKVIKCDNMRRKGRCDGIKPRMIVASGVLCSECQRKDQQRAQKKALESKQSLKLLEDDRKRRKEHEKRNAVKQIEPARKMELACCASDAHRLKAVKPSPEPKSTPKPLKSILKPTKTTHSSNAIPLAMPSNQVVFEPGMIRGWNPGGYGGLIDFASGMPL